MVDRWKTSWGQRVEKQETRINHDWRQIRDKLDTRKNRGGTAWL